MAVMIMVEMMVTVINVAVVMRELTLIGWR